MNNNVRRTYPPSAILRLAWLAFVVLLSLAIPNEAAAAARSNPVAITLVVRVAAAHWLQASSPTATGATANVSSTGQNMIALEFTMDGNEPALINIPIVMRTNVNDVLFKAKIEGMESGFIWLEGGEALARAVTSRPMPVGSRVTFAVVSGLLGNSGANVGTTLPGTIAIAVPPGSVLQGRRVTVEIMMETLRQ